MFLPVSRMYEGCADVTSHAIVLWLHTLGPIEREGATVLVKP